MQNEILEYLYNNEGHTYNDILQYFIDKFPNANQSNLTYAKEVITSLIDKRLISLENDNYKFLNDYVDFQDMKDGLIRI